jgi:single-strand DNA-binding protein
MASFNSFTLMGNLTANPEIRYTPSGVPVCTFSMAVNSRRKNSEGQTVDHVDFFRITAKFKLADLCMKFLKKGRPVFVHGELESWKSDIKFGINFVASTVQFLGGDKHTAGESQNADQEGRDAASRQWAEDFGSEVPA